MFADYQRARGARRGIILVVVLGMLGLMALIGVTFATYSAQARISARNFSLAHDEPEPTEVMDFALSQLVDDTFNPVSAIRGHSLSRDMYGNDASTNGYLTVNPNSGAALVITNITHVTSGVFSGLIACTTNMSASDPGFYGYDFTRWIVRLQSQLIGGSPSNSYYVSESLEVIADDYSSGTHVLYVTPNDATAFPNNLSSISGYTSTTTPVTSQSTLAGALLNTTSVQFTLDGRYLRAFNGPGLSAPVYPYGASGAAVPANVYGNFRLNGPLLGSPYGPMGDPNAVGMDEDYDACDLDNWFLAIQSADGQVVIPSFHRPAILRASPTNMASNDWNNFLGTNPQPFDSMSRILRPRMYDGHSSVSFPDLLPGSTGQITYDVDNDGDGLTDSVWLDLGYPPRRDPTGRIFKPLYAFLIIGLNGRLPLNTAGNLQDWTSNVTGTYPTLVAQINSGGGGHSSSRLGYSPSEVDPTYALQNAADASLSLYTQVDNANVSVNLTQLRNILTGTRAQPSLTAASALNGDLNTVLVNGALWYLPNGQADTTVNWGTPDLLNTTDANGNPALGRAVPSVAGRWGESGGVPGYPLPLYAISATGSFKTTIAAGLSLNYSPDPGNGAATSGVGIEDDNFTAYDPTGRQYDFIDYSGSLAIPTERVRRFASPVDLTGNGILTSYNIPVSATSNGQVASGYGPDAFGRVMFQQYFRPSGKPTQVGNVAPAAGADLTTNPLHGFDSERNPYLTASDGNRNSLMAAAGNGGRGARLGQNEADEMRLYTPNEYDEAFDVGDLQWLYRLQDVDGPTLTSRLSSLAPVSFLNPADGARRRRLFALDAWETTNFVWAPDNPQGAFPDNSRFGFVANQFLTTGVPLTANASFANLNLPAIGTGYPFGYFSPYYNGGYGPYNAFPPTNTNSEATFSYTNSLTGIGEGSYDPSTVNWFSTPSATPATAMTSWPMLTPPVAQRDRKINLNYPLPVSNDPNEPIRRKWIRETYYALKAILPPQSVDTPAECAQLSQFVINIIDFRDPDGTMTHWVNPDVVIIPPVVAGGSAPQASQLVWTSYALANSLNYWNCDQFGMEYLPVAINEVLAYSFLRKDLDPAQSTATAAAVPTNRFFVELVNTLNQSATGPTSGISTGGTAFSFDPSDAFASGATVNTSGNAYTTTGLDLSNWDLVIAEDDIVGRPDPTTGQLVSAGALGTTMAYNELYGPIPLVAGSVAVSNGAATPQPGYTSPTSFIDFTQNNSNSGSGGSGGSGTTTTGLQLPQASIRQPIQLPALMPQVSGSTGTVPNSNNNGQMTAYYQQYYVTNFNATQPTYGTTNTTYSPSTSTSNKGTTTVNFFTGGNPPNAVFPPPWGPNATGIMQQRAALNYFFVMGNLLPVIPKTNSPNPYSPLPMTTGAEFVSNLATAPEYQPPLIVNPIPDQMMTFLDGDSATANKVYEYDVFDSAWQTDLVTGTARTPAYLSNSLVKPTLDTNNNPVLVNATNTTPGVNVHTPGIAVYPLPQLVNTSGTTKTGKTKYYWLYLRRPANPFQQTTDTSGTLPGTNPATLPQPPAAGSGNNPMVVVDCMRFAYIEGSGQVTKIDQQGYSADTAITTGANQIFSIQRLQPFRGGHTVLTTLASGATPYSGSNMTIINGVIPAYGLSEQTAPATSATPQVGASSQTGSQTGNYGYFGQKQVTIPIFETLGQQNSPCEPADYFPFNDRDFMSVAELVLVPGCPPGLFTKQFVENAPENFVPTLPATFSTGASQVTPPSSAGGMTIAGPLISQFTNNTTGTLPAAQPVVPHVYPYLNDDFFYTAASPQLLNSIGNQSSGTGPVWPKVGGPSGAGWHKLFEFFEVPSPALGAIDTVANGMNYDWARQDIKPGLLNLNLIIDEEVWLGLMGNLGLPNDSLNLSSIPMLNSNLVSTPGQAGVVENGAPVQYVGGTPVPLVPHVVTLTDTSGSPYLGTSQLMAYPMSNVGFFLTSVGSNQLKGAFSDFLKLRHGGSGYLFAWGQGPVGNIPTTGYTGQANYPAYPVNSPAAERPFHALSYPDIDYTIMRPAALPPPPATALPTPASSATGVPLGSNVRPSVANGGPGLFWDPGVKDPYALYPYTPTAANAGTDTYPVAAVVSSGGALVNTFEPADTPPRRLFQIPDAYGYPTVTVVTNPPPYLSNASLWGTGSGSSPTAGTGRNNYVQDFALSSNMYDLTGGSTVYLGNATSTATAPPYDNRQHPYYRTEWLQKVMNLTTVRTHQYAVWITVGFFEVTKQGDQSLASDPTNFAGAIDILGDELNASTGRNKRLRSFFLLDRTKAVGFNPGTPGDFRTVVVYRQTIQE